MGRGYRARAQYAADIGREADMAGQDGGDGRAAREIVQEISDARLIAILREVLQATPVSRARDGGPAGGVAPR